MLCHLTARWYNFVSVTRRSIRVESWYPAPAGPQSCHAAPRASVVSSGGARRVRRSFCHQGPSFIDHYACRGTKWIEDTNLSKCNRCYKRALAQCRGTSCLGARNLSRCKILIGGRCGRPGAYTITKLSWEQEQKQKP